MIFQLIIVSDYECIFTSGNYTMFLAFTINFCLLLNKLSKLVFNNLIAAQLNTK